jgi:hypothetical protein
MHEDVLYYWFGLLPAPPEAKAECFARETNRTMPKYNADAVVQIGREAMRQIMALGYTTLGRSIIIQP